MALTSAAQCYACAAGMSKSAALASHQGKALGVASCRATPGRMPQTAAANLHASSTALQVDRGQPGSNKPPGTASCGTAAQLLLANQLDFKCKVLPSCDPRQTTALAQRQGHQHSPSNQTAPAGAENRQLWTSSCAHVRSIMCTCRTLELLSKRYASSDFIHPPGLLWCIRTVQQGLSVHTVLSQDCCFV
jgi:hypothetical protein